MRAFSLLIIVGLLMAGCVTKPVSSMLTKKEAVAIAVSMVKKSDAYDYKHYRAPEAQDLPGLKKWHIWFDEKEPSHPDGFIVVSINATNGMGKFLPVPTLDEGEP